MIILSLTSGETDDPRFVSLAAEIVTGAVATHKPPEICMFKIDHWFDHKWLGFSGKFIGAVGSWRKQLTVPPFVKNRIVGQWRYSVDSIDGHYRQVASPLEIHHQGPAQENLRRSLQHIAPLSAFFWYSGDTLETGRGSLMGYIPVDSDHWPWFLAFVREEGEWRISRRKQIHEYEVRVFREAAGNIRSVPLPSDVAGES